MQTSCKITLFNHYYVFQVISEDSQRGGISFITTKKEETMSILLIEDADLGDSGKYSCYPSNTEITSIRVHVLKGKYETTILSIYMYIGST